MKVFISQPMAHKTQQEILNEREKLVKLIKKEFGEDTEIIDSYFPDALHDAEPLWYLGKAIQLMSGADIVVMAKEWWHSRGCKCEYDCARSYDKCVIESMV
jgi:hypothetical protein